MINPASDEWFEASLEEVTRPDAPIGYGIVQPGPYVPGGIPVIAIRDLPNPAMRTVNRSSPDIESRYRRSRVAPGDILISVKGTTGRVGFVPDGFEGNISRDVARVRLREEQESRYWFQLLRSTEAQTTLQLAAVGTTRQELSIGTLKKLRFRFPRRDEQELIAEILADADEFIASIERAIVKKRSIKHGIMQQLLTGGTRLPGFATPWQKSTVGAVAEVKTGPFGTALHERDYVARGTPIITVEHLGEYGVNGIGAPMVSETDRRRLRAYLLAEGDIVFSRVGSIDRNARISVQESAWLFSGRLLRVRFNPAAADSRFMSAQFRSKRFTDSVKAVAVGQTMPSLNTSILSGIEIALPSVDEQRAIGMVAESLDQELQELQARLEKAHKIKQGIMQQLLTRRTRLPV